MSDKHSPSTVSVNDRATVLEHLPLRPVEFLVLATLLEDPRHGYAMVKEVEAQTAGKIRLRPGDLYRVLARLERRGLLTVAERRPASDADDRRRTYYQLTDLGRAVGRAEAEIMSSVSHHVLSKTQEGASV